MIALLRRRPWTSFACALAIVGILVACDYYVGPNLIGGTLDQAQYRTIVSDLRKGSTRAELYANLRRLSKVPHGARSLKSYPQPTVQDPHPSVWLEFFNVGSGFCVYNGTRLTIDFDAADRVNSWKTAAVHDAC